QTHDVAWFVMKHHPDIAKPEEFLEATSQISEQIGDVSGRTDSLFKSQECEVLLLSQTRLGDLSCTLDHLNLANLHPTRVQGNFGIFNLRLSGVGSCESRVQFSLKLEDVAFPKIRLYWD